MITDIAEIGDALIEHPVPKVISFTGSDRVGRHVATVAASHFKRAILELGGNSALVVLDDADVDYAVDAAVFSRFVHQGQVCMAANRVLVDRSVEREFTEKFVAKVQGTEGRRPGDPATHIGPLINSRQAERSPAIVEQAVAEGATALRARHRRGQPRRAHRPDRSARRLAAAARRRSSARSRCSSRSTARRRPYASPTTPRTA